MVLFEEGPKRMKCEALGMFENQFSEGFKLQFAGFIRSVSIIPSVVYNTDLAIVYSNAVCCALQAQLVFLSSINSQGEEKKMIELNVILFRWSPLPFLPRLGP